MPNLKERKLRRKTKEKKVKEKKKEERGIKKLIGKS